MGHKEKVVLRAVLVAIFGAFVFAVLVPAASEGFSIDWWTVDGGGGTSQGGDYTVSGSIGQLDVGSSQGGDFALEGGFWAGIIDSVKEFFIHLPLVQK